jgi:hypothetical protein
LVNRAFSGRVTPNRLSALVCWAALCYIRNGKPSSETNEHG